MTFNISTYTVDKLGRHAEIQPGYAFKSERFTDDSSDVALVKGENVQQGFVDWKVSKYWPVGDAETFKNFELRIGDVVLAMDRPWVTAGLKWAYIKKDDPSSLLVQRVARLRAKKGLDQTYLRCLISSGYFSNYLQPIVTGVNVPHISGKQIGDFKIPLPALSIQKQIAAVLSSYDELIYNNQQHIALLEKMADEIYREWFVRLRFPGHGKLKLVKGVPDGWKVKHFHEIIEYYIGGGWGEDFQSSSFSEAAFVIRGTDIPDIQAGEFEDCPYRFHKPSNLKSRTLQPGDFVFEVSGGSKDQLLGRNVFITERMLKFFKEPVIAASFCKQIRFSRELVSPYLMKYFLKLYYDYDLVGIYQIQSTGISNFQFESFLKYQTIVLPPSELQNKFEDMVKPIIDMRDSISLANIELRKTRGLLLPRLISGKLSVENLDIQFPPSMAEEAHA